MRAIAVNIIPPEADKVEAMKNFEELARLVETYGGIIIMKILQKRGRPSAKTFLGPGKAEEVAQIAKNLQADLVIVNNFLKANQANHLKRIIDREVWDRFELILKIFQKHAKTPEAKLQIELAALKYEFPKLFGKGAAMSQQAGHIGIRSGRGEKLLEIKKRHLRRKIQEIEHKLKNIHHVQSGQRARRQREGLKTAALVGYTNSGKTTLLQALTKKQNLYIKDELFATLDTRIGRLNPPSSSEEGVRGWCPPILIADTIGFIRDLPPILFSTFLTTLEEVKQADLLLHVIDASDPKMTEKIAVVEHVLQQLKVAHKKQIYIFNKIDQINAANNQNDLKKLYQPYQPIFISAFNKKNINKLKELIMKNIA